MNGTRLARCIVGGLTLAAAIACFIMGRQDPAMRSLGWIILGIAALAYVSNRMVYYANHPAGETEDTPRPPTEREKAAYARPVPLELPARLPATLLRYRLRRLAQWDSAWGWADEAEGHLEDTHLELQFFFSGEQWVAAGRMLQLDCALSPARLESLAKSLPLPPAAAARLATRRANVLLSYDGHTLSVTPHTAVERLRPILFIPILGEPQDFDAYMDGLL